MACGASDVGSGAAESGFHSCHPACVLGPGADVLQLSQQAAVWAGHLEVAAPDGPHEAAQQHRADAVEAVGHSAAEGGLFGCRVDGRHPAAALFRTAHEVPHQLVTVPDVHHFFVGRQAELAAHRSRRMALLKLIHKLHRAHTKK